ncbi:DUF4926 domain-containing protein [Paraglaciecola hydrolytica]|uniref:DUF4926 domain-containing protein n=1 Tax=Paraglaciecola hydrolytica TaxID=1799789 RepID=A0A136A2D6_9ALTE|nr:DUF4926 domain-containing protein [Paraglaciecola hydrolytica]KXI29395.1 hypothetical protein AX660_14775 [Paraglaciecola hydrolytica]
MEFKQYDVIKVLEISNPKKLQGRGSCLGYCSPKIGDVGTIVEIYTTPCLGYDIECSDEKGVTKWLTTFEPSEIKMEVVCASST